MSSYYGYFCLGLIPVLAIGLIYQVLSMIKNSFAQKKRRLQQLREEAVITTSHRYAAILSAVQQAEDSIIPLKKTWEQQVCSNSLTSYSNFNETKYFNRFISENQERCKELIKSSQINRKIYLNIERVFQRKFSETKADWKLACELQEMSYEEYCETEDALCKRVIPKIVFNLQWTVTVSYTSPAGRNHYVKDYSLNENGVQSILDELEQIDPIETFKKKQRSLLTKKLRYQILKRDGFRCVICGRGMNDGIKQLEVDHIFPVSKGGKTEWNNLRTLCYDCNQGKRDEYEENGVN